MTALSENEYIVRELRKQQKLMETRKLIGLEGQSWSKLQKIYKWICESGVALRDPEVIQYLSEVPGIEKRLPGDKIHKIMFI